MIPGISGPWELLIIFTLAMVLFGYKKLPEAGRNLGRSLRIFKSEVREMKAESSDPALDEADHFAGHGHAGATRESEHGRAGGQRQQHEVPHS